MSGELRGTLYRNTKDENKRNDAARRLGAQGAIDNRENWRRSVPV